LTTVDAEGSRTAALGSQKRKCNCLHTAHKNNDTREKKRRKRVQVLSTPVFA